MGSHGGGRTVSRRRLLLIGAMSVTGAAAVAFAIGSQRLAEDRQSGPSAEQLAQERCQSDVRKRLVAPTSAHFSDIRIEQAALKKTAKTSLR